MSDEPNADQPMGQDPQPAQPRRRRQLGDDRRPPEPESAPTPRSGDADSRPDDMTLANVDLGMGRRKREPSGAPPPEAPPTSPPPAPEAATPEPGRGEKGKPKGTPDEPAKPAGPSGVQRAIRILLILLVMLAMVGFFVFLLDEQKRQEFYGGGDDIPKFDFLPPDPEGDAFAGELVRRIRQDGAGEVLAMRAQVADRRPVNGNVMRAILLAESVEAVRLINSELGKLPSTEASKGEFLPIEEKLKRIGPRVALLSRLAEYRTDWGDELTAVPAVAAIYRDTAVEISATSKRIANWDTALAQLRRALDDISMSNPDFDAVRSALALAAEMVPENNVGRVIRNVEHLKNAQNMLAVMDMQKANDNISLLELRSAPQGSRYVEDLIEDVLARRAQGLKGQFVSWRSLWEEGERAANLYGKGNTEEAASALAAALKEATIDSVPIKTLHDRLQARLSHYQAVLAAWNRAEDAERKGDFAARIGAWQAFALTITKDEDPAQLASAQEHIDKLRGDIAGEIAVRADKLGGIWEAYTPPDASTRAPTTPRSAFGERVAPIPEAANLADEILGLAALAPQWTNSGKPREAANLSRRVLQEQSEQAQRLWNVGRIYRERGEIEWFRECMERVLLLGDNKSNPFFLEARKVLAESGVAGGDGGNR